VGVHDAEYRKKLTTPGNAVKRIKNGDTIIHGTTVAEPPALLGAIADRARAGALKGVKIYSFNPQEHASKTYLAPDLCDCIEAYSWFVSKANRPQSAVGLTQFIPSYLHQVPRLIRDHMEVDVTVTTVSPMDKAGFFTFGTANDLISTAARECKTLIVEVNRNMPRVFGDSLLHVSEVDAVVENHVRLMQISPPEPKPEDGIIGKAVAELVPDGAVLQLGVGALPNAITPYLMRHRDLGIHTELFGPGMVELIKKGVANGRRKTIHTRKHVFSVAYGTDSTFEFMNDNPSLESYPSSYVMDPRIIAQNDNMVAVNSILEVDVTGQCNAEHMAGFQFSGTGGQLDFVRGAYAARGGMSIMTFYSTAKNGEISRVVPRLRAGATVTTPRMDTHYLATEYGVVNLKQKSVRERAEAIISIAHPKFRDDLLKEALRMGLM
jgi:itaconate CoA-transferase